MAARRLIIVLLVLLVVSSVAAALIPVERDVVGEDETTTSTTSPPGPQGDLVRRTIDASGNPETIRLRVGDQLELGVRFQRADQVAIPRLGELQPVDPDAPARFDLIATNPGTYRVRLLDAQSTVARIEVERPDRRRRGAEKEGGRSGGSGGDGDRDRDQPDRPVPAESEAVQA